MAITAAQVKQLRELTGAGIMDTDPDVGARDADQSRGIQERLSDPVVRLVLHGKVGSAA